MFWICFTQNCHFPLKVSDIGSQHYSIPSCCINTSKHQLIIFNTTQILDTFFIQRFLSAIQSIWIWTQLLDMMRRIATRENTNKAPRIMWSAVSSKEGRLPNILRKSSEDYWDSLFLNWLCPPSGVAFETGIVSNNPVQSWSCVVLVLEVLDGGLRPTQLSTGLLGIIWFHPTL